MFVRVKTTPNSPRRSVQIVAGIRHGNKVKQKIVRHVGVAMDEDELARLQELGEFIVAKLQSQYQPSLFASEQVAEQVIAAKKRHDDKDNKPIHVNIKKLKEEQRITTGIHEVYGEIYQQLKFDKLLPASRYTASHRALFHCVMARIANPESKRKSVHNLETDFGIHIALEKVYRMMDHLDDKRIERLKTMAGKAAESLIAKPLDVLFFDCTTLYFESFTEDALKQNGYSKDCKFNQPQVLLALMVTEHGLPVSYEVFPGATFEGHSLLPVIEKMRSQYQLNRVICVADKGMMSEDNLKALEAIGCGYIVGAKLKQLPRSKHAKILDKTAYDSIEKEGLQVMEMTHNDRRIIVSYSPQRAHNDKHKREKAINKLLNKLKRSNNPKDLLNNYGYKKFVCVQGDAKLSIDTKKVETEAQWDGIHGVITNITDMPGAEAISHYHGLWQVEESFRITKHDLKVRPIYHWTPLRVRAHIAMAFMALTCVRHLSYQVSLQYRRLSPEVIRKALVHIQATVLSYAKMGKRYVLPSKVNQHAKKIYQLMGIKSTTTPYPLD